MPINASAFFEANRATSGGALSSGIERGLNISQGFQQQRRAAQQQEFNQSVTRVNSLASVFGNKSLPTSMRVNALNQYIRFSNENFETKFNSVSDTDFDENDAVFKKLSSQLLGIAKDETLTPALKRQAAMGINLETAKNFKQAGEAGKLIESFFGESKEQEPKDFTLGPGQTRFGPKGVEIASVDPQQAEQEQISPLEKARVTNSLVSTFQGNDDVDRFSQIDLAVKAMSGLEKLTLTEQNKIAIQQGIITLFNKVTDPQSVVRESEFARTPENTAITNRMMGALQKWAKGGAGLTNDDLRALVLASKVIRNEAANRFNSTLSRFSQIGSGVGIEASNFGQIATPLRIEGEKITPQQLFNEAARMLGPNATDDQIRNKARQLKRERKVEF